MAPYLTYLDKASKIFGATLQIKSISEAWERRLGQLLHLYCGFRSLKQLPKELSITAAGNPIRKVLGTALQREGTLCYVLHHGDCAGVERYPHAHRNDSSFCDYFVSPNPVISENFKANYAESLLARRSGTQYLSAKSSHYDVLFQSYRPNVKTNNNGRRVMLIGYGMNHTRYLDGAGYFSYFQLDLQYRVARLIKSSCYELIYKVHPDRSAEVGNLFAPYADLVEQRPFQNVWNNADYYVFTHPGTTVFGHAVLTNKPMILLDLTSNNWNEAGYNFLKARCHMVPSYFDSNNRILFDEEELIEKLNNPLELDDNYIHRYLL